MSANTVFWAFFLTWLAGLSTGIGGLIVYFAKTTNTKFLSFSLGFSAGVMIYVSFVEIFAHGRNLLGEYLGPKAGYAATAASFFAGVLLAALIDRMVPSYENPHEARTVEEARGRPSEWAGAGLFKTGVLTAVIVTVHNFPEGLATFTASLDSLRFGIPIAIAVAIHNIPEGISISLPVYYATGSRRKALFYSFASGLAEPLGAAAGYVFLKGIFNDAALGLVFGLVAGIMVFISLDQLLPTAEKYGEHHLAAYGLVSGMAVMAVSLLLFA
ncbi:MAG TPA: zinc transporter ZupT [Candidatus Aminicenantes bacterium]|nr:zinc transporter ZupT [Candidatus Aminicenantes bacterium]